MAFLLQPSLLVSHTFPVHKPYLYLLTLTSHLSPYFTFGVFAVLASMASVSATSLSLEPSLKFLGRNSQASWGSSSLRTLSVRWTKTSFPSFRTSRFRISCAAKPETMQKVCEIVRKQLALPPESELTPETKFSALGADSLDTVEIVMGLEEAFNISVEEESSDNITTVQEAADLIEKLVQKKAAP